MIKNYLTLLFIGTLSYTFAQDNAAKYANTITAEELKEHLYIIAADDYLGRETGKEGQKMAAKYLANDFKKNGVLPGAKDGSYFQQFPLIEQHSGGTDIEVNGNKFNFLEDFYFFRGFNDTTFLANEVVFVGYGINEKKYNDYKDFDVKGKVVMVLGGEPFKKGKSLITKSKEHSAWSVNWRLKQEEAKKRGAKAILIVQQDVPGNVTTMLHYIESPSMMLDLGKSEPSKRIPNFYISDKIANGILANSDLTTDGLRATLNKKSKPVICNTTLKITMNREIERLTAENVLGFIEGTDKKEEVLILTAHYDHIGVDEKKGEVYNGADDDGSGTVALLEIAQAFAEAKKEGNGPRRSVLIMPVSGEEKGLLGSQYYSENPVYPLENTVADLNIDMIGRLDDAHKDNPDYIYVIGSNMLSTELHDVNETANSTYTKLELDYTYNKLDDPNRYYYRSDHYNFAKHNIPVIFYFNGVHADYHKPTDTVDKIDFNKMEKITKLVFHTAWELANREEKIKVNVIQPAE